MFNAICLIIMHRVQMFEVTSELHTVYYTTTTHLKISKIATKNLSYEKTDL